MAQLIDNKSLKIYSPLPTFNPAVHKGLLIKGFFSNLLPFYPPYKGLQKLYLKNYD